MGILPDWEDYLTMPSAETTDEDPRKHSRTGRAAGDNAFIGVLETLVGRRLKRRKPGPRPADAKNYVDCHRNSDVIDKGHHLMNLALMEKVERQNHD